jgi:uncharacterized protein YodC (DUF2158 family)
MSDRVPIQVTCTDCGMSAEVRLEAHGPRYYVTDIASSSKCKYDWRGMTALECSGLKSKILRASKILKESIKSL